MDAWVSPTGEHIRNYMLICDAVTFFHSSTTSGSVAATGEAIERWEWMLFDVHCAAYVLSPEYHRDNVYDNARIMRGLKEIVKFFATTTGQRHAALAEFATLKNNADPALFEEHHHHQQQALVADPWHGLTQSSAHRPPLVLNRHV